MNIRATWKRLNKFAKKRRRVALITNLSINGLPLKGKRMSDKPKKSEKYAELQETLDTMAEQLAETVNLAATLKREVADLKKTVSELKQLCSLGQ